MALALQMLRTSGNHPERSGRVTARGAAVAACTYAESSPHEAAPGHPHGFEVIVGVAQVLGVVRAFRYAARPC